MTGDAALSAETGVDTLPFHLHSSRDGRLLLFVHAVLTVLRGSFSFAVPWVVLQRGFGVDVAVWVVALVLGGYLLSAAPAARWSASGHRRTLLLAAALASTAAAGGVSLWQLTAGPAPLPLLAGAVVVVGMTNGALLAGSYPAAETLVRPAALRAAHGPLNTFDQLGGLGAGAVGAVILQYGSFGWLLLGQTIAGAMAVAAVGLLRLPSDPRPQTKLPQRSEGTLRQAWRSPVIRRLYVAGMAWNLGAGAFLATLVAWLHVRLELTAGEAAWVIAAAAAGSIVSGFVLSHSRVRVPTSTLLVAALLLHAACLAVAGVIPAGEVLPAAALLGVLMLGNSSAAGLFVTARAELCDVEDRAAVLMVGQTLHRLGLFVAYLTAGALIVPLGFPVLYVLSACLVAALAVMVASTLSRVELDGAAWRTSA